MPTLSIIAGPNGAGKSSLSAELYENTGVKPFDFDYEFLLRWSQFSFDPSLEQTIHLRTQEEYERRKTESLSNCTDFAFETNYHDESVLRTILEFRNKGHRIEVIFLFLSSPQEAVSRVNTRVLQGGHAVSIQTIHERFYMGLSLLDKTFDSLFNEVFLFLSQESTIAPIGYLNFDRTDQHMRFSLPPSVSSYLPRMQKFFSYTP